MALRVWLPLNGNLENKGLSNIKLTSGTAVYLDNGKIGKCISLSSRINFSGLPKMEKFSILFWAKVDSCSNDWADLLGLTSKQNDGTNASDFRFEATKTSRACSFHNNSPYAITQASRILIEESQKGEWHHCGFTYDGVNCWTYIDGVSYYKDTGLGGYLIDYFHIGENDNIVGGMNDLRIYDECLSPKQIKEISKGLIAHYKLEGIGANPNLLKGTNLGTNGWTYGVGSRYNKTMEEVEWKGVRACKFGITDGDTSSTSNWRVAEFRTQSFSNVVLQPSTQYTISFDTDKRVINSCSFRAGNAQHPLGDAASFPSTVMPDGSYHYKIQITTVASDSESWTYDDQYLYMQYLVPVNDFGIIANLKLEEGTVETKWVPHKEDTLYTSLGYNNILTTDVSGNGYNLTSIDGNLTQDMTGGRYESAVHRETASQPIGVIPPIFSSGQEIPELTLSGWLKTNSSLVNKNLINLGNNKFIRFGPTTTGNLWVYIRMGSVNKDLNVASVGTLDDLWHHYVITFKNGVITAYIDGVEKGNADYSSTSTFLTCAETNNYIGGYNVNQELVSGSVSDIRIYATALSANDIKELYQTAAWIDNGQNFYTYEFKEV